MIAVLLAGLAIIVAAVAVLFAIGVLVSGKRPQAQKGAQGGGDSGSWMSVGGHDSGSCDSGGGDGGCGGD